MLSIVSILRVKKGGRLQIILLIILLCILALFIGQGLLYTGVNHFQPFIFELTPIMSTAGMVYVSYVGVAKVVSLSEEIKNPGLTGIFLRLTIFLIVGIMNMLFFDTRIYEIKTVFRREWRGGAERGMASYSHGRQKSSA